MFTKENPTQLFQDLGSKEKPNYIIPSWITIEISSYEGYPLLHSYDEKVVSQGKKRMSYSLNDFYAPENPSTAMEVTLN